MILRRLGLAVAAGLLLYAGHPPWDQAWAGAVALVPLLLLARDVAAGGERPARRGFLWGLVAGAVFFAPLLLWISRFGVAPWVVLTLLEALFVGAFVALVAAWGDRAWRGALAVVAWVAFEWLRARVPLGGFPWGALAYTQHGGGPVLPVARVAGAMGVSAVLATASVCIESLAHAAWRRSVRGAVVPAVTVAVVALGLLMVPEAPPPNGRSIDMAGIQGNDVELPPFVDRANAARVEDIAQRMVAVTGQLASSAEGMPDVVVWPENALDTDPRAAPQISAMVSQAQASIGDATLLAGVLLDGQRPGTFRNAVVRFGPAASIAEVYDKRKLVPFGEYVPWRSVLGGLPPLQAIPNDGVAGTEPHTFAVAGAAIGPVTCYESLYSDLVRDQVLEGAQVLLVSTNNASYGRTPASRQHLAFSEVRAVETGRWVLHVGISGISAIVDPDGGLTQQTGLFEQAIVRGDLPLVDGVTPYVRVGDVVGPLSVAFTLLALVGLIWRRKRDR